MRFATYEHQGLHRVATVDDDGTLRPVLAPASLLDLLRAGPAALREAGNATPDVPDGPHVSQVRLLPPLQPPSVRDFVTFEEHVEGMRRSIDNAAGVPDAWYDAPTFYFTNPYAVIGAHDDVPVPPGSSVLDFELEVAAVIGVEGRDLTPEQARDHIIGYTIFNDWSARDLQSAEMRVGLGPARARTPPPPSARTWSPPTSWSRTGTRTVSCGWR